MSKYRLREGAPKDDELLVRVTVLRTYKPNLEDYIAVPEANVTAADTVLDAMLYDKESVKDGAMDFHELLFPISDDDQTLGVWEVVDKEGTVWSECLETEETTTEQD